MTKQEQIIHLLRTTTKTNAEIRKLIGCRGQLVSDILLSLGSEYSTARKASMYRRSKLGTNNPMLGVTGIDHPTYKGRVSDGKGYMMVLKPDWFTGRKGSRHIFEHTFVYCLDAGLTEIEHGYCVHHCNQTKDDNRIGNLICMTQGEHQKLHSVIGSATTISKESTAKWLEAVRRGDTYDIV